MGRLVRFVQSLLFCAATLLLVASTMCAQDALPISSLRTGGLRIGATGMSFTPAMARRKTC